ncbi:MAG: DUF1326 domain-containing protein [Chloroflexota bacterium]
MSWSMDGTYLENCNCDATCPCTWSWLKLPATHERCNALLAFHIDSGEIDGTDVSDLTFGMVLDAPANMVDGNWRVGVLLDDRATEEQAGKLGAVLGGQMGGPPSVLAPLISEILGIETVPVTYEDDGRQHRVRFGDMVDTEVEDMVNEPFEEPVQLTNIPHPAASTLTMATGTRSTINAFGIQFDGAQTSGFSAPFHWTGE